MDLGVGLPTSGPHASAEAIVRIARGAEELGYTAEDAAAPELG